MFNSIYIINSFNRQVLSTSQLYINYANPIVKTLNLIPLCLTLQILTHRLKSFYSMHYTNVQFQPVVTMQSHSDDLYISILRPLAYTLLWCPSSITCNIFSKPTMSIFTQSCASSGFNLVGFKCLTKRQYHFKEKNNFPVFFH